MSHAHRHALLFADVEDPLLNSALTLLENAGVSVLTLDELLVAECTGTAAEHHELTGQLVDMLRSVADRIEREALNTR